MVKEKPLWDLDQLTNYFTLFVVGTITSLIWFFFKFPDISIWNNIRTSLILITILTYEFVFVSLIVYQFSKVKKKLITEFLKDREKYFVLIVVILAITYLGFIWFRNKDIMNLIQNAFITIIALVSIPQVNKRLTKWWKKLKPKKLED